MFGLNIFGKKEISPQGSANPEISSLPPIKRLGSFQLEKIAGRGSMGVVYRGRDEVSGRDVAVKTMDLAKDFDANSMGDAYSRFIQEARILTWLDHPDIVVIYDVGEDNGTAYIAMEFVDGIEMSTHVYRDNLLPLPRVLEIIARVADALGYAHENNIVHRDVKPGNIMYIEKINQVKVADFGISRLTQFSRTRAGLVLGSPPYMSPEQIMGSQINGLSDIFSLGTTLFQLASGRLPFEADTPMEVMRCIVDNPHRDILSIDRKKLPAGLATIIDRALAKNPENRYQSGFEMAEEIRNCLSSKFG